MNEVQISQIDGVPCHTISDYDQMPPFFMSLVSSSDHWLFLSSTGGVTAGRKNADNALFPYYTDDKIHDSCTTTGPVTLLSVTSPDAVHFWQPFATHVLPNSDSIERLLHKSVWGNAVVFEERNRSLGLTFSYRWSFSDRLGIVRTARLRNDRSEPVSIEIVDGLRNVLPAGTDRTTQERLSTLLDGYKRTELIENTRLGIYALSSIITDRAEPSESLLANTVWSLGFPEAKISVDPSVLTSFPPSLTQEQSTEVRGRRGVYLHHATFVLENEKTWFVVADVGKSNAAVANLESYLATHPEEKIRGDIADEMVVDTDRLRRFVAKSDGLQVSGDERLTGRHYTNTLFNIMRGGVFADGYSVSRDEFLRFCRRWNGPVCDRFQHPIQELPERVDYSVLRTAAQRVRATGAPGSRDFGRIIEEFLPLSFSRRHGDPSRPWNRFSIDLFSSDGTPMIAYQGNWRDIFQNWEALAHSFPLYLEGMISRFLNATTADGYNPYRISQDGIDWEVFDPDDPWSNIGYWNDHQIVYLYRLMKLLNDHQPEVLPRALRERTHVFADVPYRIKSFAQIIEDPRETIDFDDERQTVIDARVARIGADGKLLHNGDEIVYVSLLEKVLILVLTKIGNLVPGGGIWMNTQRPEWNDANNALVGWGVSIVTVAHLRRFLVFLLDSVLPDTDQALELSKPVARFLSAISDILARFEGRDAATDPTTRYAAVMELGAVADTYRRAVYSGEIGRDDTAITFTEIRDLLSAATRCLERSIKTAERSDALYHSYNLMHLHDSKIEIAHLPLMLEGQVAVLSAGMLDSTDVAALVDALYESALYRPDQNSFTLYPDKSLRPFMEKNTIPSGSPETSSLLDRITTATGDQIVQKDANGAFHFHADFRNAPALQAKLDELGVGPDDQARLVEVYEELFHHRSFTGRSGTFFKYEGLGSIYWHMVSKLLLAVAEQYESEPHFRLTELFHRVRDGIGIHKTADAYGAFPTDPYSHTPSFAGAQQPGMTGQVKEDIISRFTELGAAVADGQITFAPRLLTEEEFLPTPARFTYLANTGEWDHIDVPARSLAFTYCGVPVVYTLADAGTGKLCFDDGTVERLEWTAGVTLSRDQSWDMFSRSVHLKSILVEIPADSLK